MEQVKDHGLCDISYSFVLVREGCICRNCRQDIHDIIAIRQTLQGKVTNYYHQSCMKRDRNMKNYLRLQTTSKAISKQDSSVMGRKMNQRDRYELPSIHVTREGRRTHRHHTKRGLALNPRSSMTLDICLFVYIFVRTRLSIFYHTKYLALTSRKRRNDVHSYGK